MVFSLKIKKQTDNAQKGVGKTKIKINKSINLKKNQNKMSTDTKIPEKKDINNRDKKLFILDTNIIIRDPMCIFNFAEHDIAIPAIVLQELDKYKKGTDMLNFNVREFHRQLKKLREKKVSKEFTKKRNGKGGKIAIFKDVPALANGGVEIAPGLGKIQIHPYNKRMSDWVKNNFLENTADDKILATVAIIEEDLMNKPGNTQKVILVTKDANLQFKADLCGIDVEDYETDKIASVDSLYTGRGVLINPELKPLIDVLSFKKEAPIFGAEYSQYIPAEEIIPNKFMTIKAGQQSVLACVDPKGQMFRTIDKTKMSAAGIVPLNTEQVFSMYALLNPNIHLVTLLGKAGSGKTLLAIATALEQLRQGIYKKIIIAAAMVPLSDKPIGALPGGIDAKVSPYMQGFFDNLDFIRNELKGKWDKEPDAVNATKKRKKTEKPASSKRKNAGRAAQQRQQVVAQSEEGPKDFITQQLALGNIQIQALATIRGRSLNNVKFILDESQNISLHEAKTILTRSGKNTQMVFCGDIEQIDTPYLDERSNGLSNVIDKMSNHRLVAHVTLEKGERSELADLAADRLKN